MTARREDRIGSKRPSIKDVAREAGVSIAAASYALNGRDGVAEETKRRILNAAERLNYQPSKSARSMRTGRSDSIGLVLPDLSNPFFPQFAKAVQQSAVSIGKSVLLIDTDNDPDIEREGVTRLIGQGVDGIIWWPTASENCALAREQDPPIVLIDSRREGFDSVTSDHWVGGKMLAALVNQSGKSRIGLIRGPANFRSATLRRDGFVDSLSPSLTIAWEETNPFAPPLSASIRSRLARSDVEIVICPDDLIAIEVIRYLRSIGSRVPTDVAVTGFGDIQFADVLHPALTTIHQPLAELGTEAVTLLRRRIDEPGAVDQNIVLPVDIVVRDSMPSAEPRPSFERTPIPAA